MTEPYMIITCAVILRAEQFKLSRLAYKGRLTKNLALLDRREIQVVVITQCLTFKR